MAKRGGSTISLALTFALAFALALGVLAFAATPAWAEESSVAFRDHYFSDAADSQASYFDIVGAAGIVRGDSGLGGPCRPAQPVTRAEFAVMVVRLLRLDPDFHEPEGAGLPFRDATTIPSWATTEVAACSALNIVNGEPDGLGGYNFNPSDTVSGAEAVAMLLRATNNSQTITGGWPAGYLFRAYETGLFSSDVTSGEWRFIEALTPVSRAQMAYLIHNALFGSRGFSPGSPGREGTFTQGSIGARLSGYSLIVDTNLLMRQLITSEGQTVNLAATVSAVGVRGSADLTGRRIFWVRNTKDQVAFIRRYSQGAAVTGELDRMVLDDRKARIQSVDLVGGRSLDLSPGAIVELNGQRWPFDPATILPVASVTAIMDQGQAAYVSIIQEDLPEAVILGLDFDRRAPGASATAPTTGRITARISMGAGDIPLVISSETAIYLNGKPADLSDLREWDVCYAATSGAVPKTVVRLYAYRNQVSGPVSNVSRVFDLGGSHWQVEVADQASSQPRTVPFSPYCADLVSVALTGRNFTFCLNRLGEATFFRAPAPEPGIPRTVKVLGISAVRGDRRLVTVDWQGSELTYLLPAEVAAPASDTLVRLTVDAAGAVVRTEAVRPALFEATVTSYDDGTGRLGLARDERDWGLYINRVPLYGISSGDSLTQPGDAVSPLTLTSGQTIWLDDPGAPAYILVEQP